MVKGVAINTDSFPATKAMLLNEYKHTALPGWNSNPSCLKDNGGRDGTRAAHHIAAMYIKALFLVNNTMYFSGFATQKYRLTEITAIVTMETVPKVKTANP